ncbi:T9SS type A sorting domain-containing protein [bacterium]|nr:T9SS type A sorting domain-containing protein [bacterium]
MRKLKITVLKTALFLLGGIGIAVAAQIVGGLAGDGGDSNPATFQFDADNQTIQMVKSDGIPITQTEVPFVYGSEIKIFNDGVDHIANRGLSPCGDYLSGSNWTNDAFPSPGNVAIDPAMGRFKFAAPCWKKQPLPIDTESTEWASPCRIGVNDSGEAWCIFQQEAENLIRLYANKYTPGSGWQGPVLIDANNGTDCLMASAAINEKGEVFCAFVHKDGLIDRIYANEYLPSSGGWQGAVIIDANTGHYAGLPRIALNNNGQAICVFTQWIDDFENQNIYANEYIPSFGWQTAVSIGTGSGEGISERRITMNDSGNAFCMFLENNILYASEYIDGEGWQSPVNINNVPGSSAQSIQIKMSSDGKAFALFEQYNATTTYGFYVNEFIPGSGWQEPENIYDDSRTALTHEPQIEINASGYAICIFAPSSQFIYACEYQPGSGWQEAEYMFYYSMGLSKFQIALNDQGRAFCVVYTAGSESDSYSRELIPGKGWQAPIWMTPEGSFYPQIALANNDTVLAMVYIPGTSGLYPLYYTNDIPYGTVQVNYNVQDIPTSSPTATTTSTPTATPTQRATTGSLTATPSATFTSTSTTTPTTSFLSSENKLKIIRRKIEPHSGEKTAIHYHLTQPGQVTIKVYNFKGRLVKTLVKEHQNVGSHSCSWGAENIGGNIVASGIYLVHIQTPNMTKTEKIAVIK